MTFLNPYGSDDECDDFETNQKKIEAKHFLYPPLLEYRKELFASVKRQYNTKLYGGEDDDQRLRLLCLLVDVIEEKARNYDTHNFDLINNVYDIVDKLMVDDRDITIEQQRLHSTFRSYMYMVFHRGHYFIRFDDQSNVFEVIDKKFYVKASYCLNRFNENPENYHTLVLDCPSCCCKDNRGFFNQTQDMYC